MGPGLQQTVLYAALLFHRWRPALASMRAVPLALACGISLATPGKYTIIFSVTNSAGLSANVSRRLVVKAVCPEGESLCDDKV
jgi:hypothetical protein